MVVAIFRDVCNSQSRDGAVYRICTGIRIVNGRDADETNSVLKLEFVDGRDASSPINMIITVFVTNLTPYLNDKGNT